MFPSSNKAPFSFCVAMLRLELHHTIFNLWSVGSAIDLSCGACLVYSLTFDRTPLLGRPLILWSLTYINHTLEFSLYSQAALHPRSSQV
ncbi:hypothetical protein CC2G_002109 [Coprinopsis cinerea AmutBmut pab1-1]|nr:hypothetical protein CC2G_002109 [Coprinopsis cinerea AmutBmut pab1-1]